MAVTNQLIGEEHLRRTTTPISECAFCTFPNKSAAAGEFARVLRPGEAETDEPARSRPNRSRSSRCAERRVERSLPALGV